MVPNAWTPPSTLKTEAGWSLQVPDQPGLQHETLEMAQKLRALAPLAQEPCSVTNSHMAADNRVTPVPGIQHPILSKHVHTYMQTLIYTEVKIN